MAWENLISAVEAVITANGNNEITGTVLKDLIVNNIIPQLGGSDYKGLAEVSTNPTATPQNEIFYLAKDLGVYPNFNNLNVTKPFTILIYRNSNWEKDEVLNIAISYLEIVGAKELTGFSSTTAANISLSNGQQTKNGILKEFNVRSSSAGQVMLKLYNSDLKLKAFQYLTLVGGVNNFSVSNENLEEMYVLKGDYIVLTTFSGIGIKYSNASIGNSYYYSTQDLFATISLTETVNGQIEMNTIVDYSEGNALKSIEEREKDVYIVGYEGVTSTSGTSASSPIFVSNFNELPKGKVKFIGVDIKSIGDGNIKILAVEPNYNNGFNVVETLDATVNRVGLNVLSIPNWVINDNKFIAIQTLNGGATISYQTTGGEGYFYKLGEVTGNDNIPLFTQGGRIVYNVFVEKTVESLDLSKRYLENVDFKSLPNNWSNNGSFNFDGTKAVSTTTGLSNYLVSDLTYGIDNRRLRWRFELTNDAEVCFLTIPREGGINAGSQIRVDAVGKALKIMQNHNSNTVVYSEPLGFDIQTGQEYIIDVLKKGRSIEVELIGVDNGNYKKIKRTTNINYQTYPTFTGYDQGALHGSPAITTLSGVINVYEFKHTYLSKENPIIRVDGDSITEGWLVSDKDKYGGLLKQELGDREVVVSGIGGTQTEGLLMRYKGELNVIKPKYHLIYIGTNTDNELAVNLMMLLSLVIRNGSIPLVATIPTRATDTTFINNLPSYITVVKFDLALSASGAGSALIKKLYQSQDLDGNVYIDTLHPNALGNKKMLDRIKVDAPEVFTSLQVKKESNLYKSFPFNSSYNTASSTTLNLVSSEKLPIGVIEKLKIDAVNAGMGYFAMLKNVGTREYEIIGYFDAKLNAGYNEINTNIFIDEEFYLAYLKGSVSINTANTNVGDTVDLHYTTSDIERGVTLTESVGRGHNIEVLISTDSSKFPQIDTGLEIEYIGDSITDFMDSVASNGKYYIGYDVFINRFLKFKAKNILGFSGIDLAGGSGFAATRVSQLTVKNVYSIFLGTNDFAGTPPQSLGSFSDFENNTGVNTYYGAFRVLIDAIYALNPTARIIIFTPNHRNYNGFNSWSTANSNGDTLIDFANACREICEKDGHLLIDLLKDCAINRKTFSGTTYDNLHPTTKGYWYIAKTAINKIKQFLNK